MREGQPIDTCTVSMGFARALVSRVELAGGARGGLLEGGAIDEEALAQPDLAMPLAELDRLVEQAAALVGDPAIGLTMWDPLPLATFGVPALASALAASFRASVALMERYQSIFVSAPQLSSRAEADALVVALRRSTPSELAHRAYVEATAGALLRVLRGSAGLARGEVQLRFDFARPSYAERYAELLGLTPEFGAAQTELVVGRAAADAPNLHHTPELAERLCHIADELLERSSARTSVRDRVLRILCDAPQNHRLPMEEVAARIGLSARSLRRKLLAEGTPYPRLVLSALKFHTEVLLRDRSRSVKDAAFTLGFRDPSAFHRAVRRCSGESPSALRTRLTPVPRADIA